ncbi:TRAP transporter large permease, partial [bacterium]|nr:TRAP transporter large permease [candidate division CSSED10-310 bacterium]
MGIATVIMALLGAPLFVIIAANTLLQLFFGDSQLSDFYAKFYLLAKNSNLLPIPLFTFAGYLLAESGAPRRLLNFTRATLGWMPGGLAIVCIGACAFFTAFTGASGVTIIALGGLLFPALIHERYKEKFSLGLVTTAGSLGLLFPPSLPLILYAVIASQSVKNPEMAPSIDALFRAGILPGLLMVLLLSIYSAIIALRDEIPRPAFSFKPFLNALWDIRYELPLPFLVLGAIYSGKIAISEAAALTAFIVLIVELLLYREIKWKDLPDIMRRSMVLVGSIMIIMGCSLSYTDNLIRDQVPHHILNFIKSFITSKLGFLLALNIFLLIVGCMLDIFSALVVVVPLIVPLALHYEIDLVHLGIVFLANLNIGYMTPPVGLNL